MPRFVETPVVREPTALRQRLSIIHGTELERQSYTLRQNEFYRCTDTGVLWTGDGHTLGGNPVIGSAGQGNDNTVAIDETP